MLLHLAAGLRCDCHVHLPLRRQPARLGRRQRPAELNDEGASRMSFRRNERGQVFAITAFSLVVLLGMSALVLDVGSWFRTKRRLQGTADAAALAGAQSLPSD